MEIPSTAPMLDRETKASERPGDHKDELRLWLRMLTCSTLIESEIRTRLREEFKTTLPRFDLMAQLEKSTTGMTVGEVSQRLMVSNGNVTAVVAGLLADGLVDKRPAAQDRRVQVLTLTAQGRRAFKAMAERHENWIAELFASLGPAEIGDGAVQAPGAFLAAEFPHHVFLARHALRREVGVQQEGPPEQLGAHIRPGMQHPPQPPDPEEAPGADQVEDDLDAEAGMGRREDVHPGRIAQPERRRHVSAPARNPRPEG